MLPPRPSLALCHVLRDFGQRGVSLLLPFSHPCTFFLDNHAIASDQSAWVRSHALYCLLVPPPPVFYEMEGEMNRGGRDGWMDGKMDGFR
jgi:hypothetical protein